MAERRNDLGSKILVSVIAILVTTIMGASIVVGQRAEGKANVNTVNIMRVETVQQGVMSTLGEIKVDIKEILKRTSQ